MPTTVDPEGTIIRLGLAEYVEARMPTVDEQVWLGTGVDEPVFVVHHVDRPPDVVPATGVRVVARNYGVRFASKPKEEQ